MGGVQVIATLDPFDGRGWIGPRRSQGAARRRIRGRFLTEVPAFSGSSGVTGVTPGLLCRRRVCGVQAAAGELAEAGGARRRRHPRTVGCRYGCPAPISPPAAKRSISLSMSVHRGELDGRARGRSMLPGKCAVGWASVAWAGPFTVAAVRAPLARQMPAPRVLLAWIVRFIRQMHCLDDPS